MELELHSSFSTKVFKKLMGKQKFCFNFTIACASIPVQSVSSVAVTCVTPCCVVTNLVTEMSCCGTFINICELCKIEYTHNSLGPFLLKVREPRSM